MSDPLAPFFLGAWGENNDLFERVLLEQVRDHIYWRRNFHPDDAPPISTRAQYEPSFHEGVATMTRELHKLTAQLKRSVPTFHPRYIGHMMSDLLLPGLIAQLTTTLYNPNNIVEEAAPVTLALEYEVGQQLSRMVGFSTDEAAVPCATGHLTSGGTLANDEALWLARAVKLLPLAVKDACAELVMSPIEGVDAPDLELLGWSVGRCLDLFERVAHHPDLAKATQRLRVETIGLARFAACHPAIASLKVIAPSSAHYSWLKAMKLLGLGAAQLELVPTRAGRIDVDAARATLSRCAKNDAPVLAVIGVYGTTEFGTFDELHELAALRTPHRSFWFHVDAAWGGYVPALFRDEHGGLRPRDEIAASFRHFPSERVYRSTAALAEADSITVDPHKLGFVPYGAGAFLARDRRALDLAAYEAAYVFTSKADPSARYRNAGRFSLEGSRPGAAAAAVALNHRVLPLDHRHFGALIERSVSACEAFFDAIEPLEQSLAGVARVAVPFEPDCNVMCVAFSPRGNRGLAGANAFTRAIFDALAVKPTNPGSTRLAEFFGSSTTVPLAHLADEERARIAAALEIDLPSSGEGLFVLRHTLMNPWLLSSPDPAQGRYIDVYVRYLAEIVRGAAAGRTP